MQGITWDIMFDTIEVVGGLYVAYQGVEMKRSGKLTSRSLIGRGIKLSKAKDMPGFIQRMYLIYIICGIIFLILGSISLFLDFASRMTPERYFIIMLLLFIDIFIFAICLIVAQKKYLHP